MVSEDGHAAQVLHLAGRREPGRLPRPTTTSSSRRSRPTDARDRPRRPVRGLQRRQRDHQRGPGPRRDDLAADRAAAVAADLRQPGRRADAGPGRRCSPWSARSPWCRLITEFTEVSVFSVNVITLLGIGLAIDYALFVVSRFREELALLPDDDPTRRARRSAHDGDRRPHRAVLRADRRRGDGQPAGLPAGVPEAAWGTAASRPCWSRCWPR